MSKNMTESYAASKKFLEKRKTMTELGQMIKSLGTGQHVEEEQVRFVSASGDDTNWLAKGKDTIVVMHLPACMIGRISQGIT